MIEKIRERPWILVILGIVFFLGMSVLFLVIALRNAPTPIR